MAVSIRLFIQPGAFEPEAIAVMSEAFEAALKELQDTGDVIREVIASRDPVRLREAALAGLKGRQ